MSTFLVSLGVVVAAIVGVVLIALADPDQPATIHPPSRRDRRHRRRIAAIVFPPQSDAGTPSPSPAAASPSTDSEPATDRPVARVRPLAGAPVREAPVREAPVREAPVREALAREARRPVLETLRPVREARRPAKGWLRLRSGVALVVLVTFVGLVLAALIGTTLALAAQALRHAVG